MTSPADDMLRRVERLFTQFNELYFSSSLPWIPVVSSRARRSLAMIRFRRKLLPAGKYCYSDFQLAVSEHMCRLCSDAEFEDVVLHEMIHYYILYHQYQDSSAHGRLFRRMMDHFNTHCSRHITISHRTPPSSPFPDMRRRHHLVCVSRLSDGRTGITVATPARLFSLWDRLPQLPGVVSCRWVVSTDPFFNRFPRSRVPKIYLCRPEETDAHLASARPLERKGNTIRPVSGTDFSAPDTL